ncbi:MAG TPA: ABC transporter permease [Bacteroidota bacterium]|nr:ABC transporter permease [Bacteroidota bacterium]
MWTELIKEFLQDIRINRTRTILTIVAVTWGTVAVVLLLAFGEGLGTQMENGLLNAGDRIMILYGGETGKQYEGMPKGRKIRMVEEDVTMLQQAIPMISMISPQYSRGVQLTVGKNSTNTECEGVNPAFEEMRRMFPMSGGRFLDAQDMILQRRVLVLGPVVAQTLFGPAEPIGKVVLVDNVPFTVVGILQKKIQTSMNNGPDDERAVIPFATFRTMYGNEHVNSIVVRPSDPAKQEELKKEIFRVLSRKYHFDPTDERTLYIWDFIENEKINRQISMGVAIFLFSVGFLTLLTAGVGVANVMYAIVKERTREIGIKLAVGARRSYILIQFLFEALFIALIGGSIGMLFSWAVVAIVHLFPSDSDVMQFLGKPVLSVATMLLTTGILTCIGIMAGLFPARRASSVDPVDSLRYE